MINSRRDICYRETPFDLFCFMMQNPYGDFPDIRVIGNRHDNPELLNVHITE